MRGGPAGGYPTNQQEARRFAKMMQEAVIVAIDKRIDEHLRVGGKLNKRGDLR